MVLRWMVSLIKCPTVGPYCLTEQNKRHQALQQIVTRFFMKGCEPWQVFGSKIATLKFQLQINSRKELSGQRKKRNKLFCGKKIAGWKSKSGDIDRTNHFVKLNQINKENESSTKGTKRTKVELQMTEGQINGRFFNANPHHWMAPISFCLTNMFT